MSDLVYVVNYIINWMQTTVLEIEGYSFSLWEVLVVDFMLCVGGYIIGSTLRKE